MPGVAGLSSMIKTKWVAEADTKSAVPAPGHVFRESQRGGASDRIDQASTKDSRSECLAPLSPFGARGERSRLRRVFKT